MNVPCGGEVLKGVSSDDIVTSFCCFVNVIIDAYGGVASQEKNIPDNGHNMSYEGALKYN